MWLSSSAVKLPQVTEPQAAPSEAHEKFLLAEYNNIAQAFFDSGTTITQFFQFYLLILTVPITLAGVLIKVTSGAFDVTTLPQAPIAPFLASFLFVIAFVGLCMTAYIINLRLDVILYARTVNGIRKYFTERANLTFDQTLPLRTLPTTTYKPDYYEGRFFLAVVLAFAVLNTFYAGVSMTLAPALYPFPLDPILLVFFFSLHFLIYWALIAHRKHYYLKARVIGIDIDGVVGNHRPTFAQRLQDLTGKVLDPDRITKIPVHTQPELNVTEDDEHSVFNEPSYWRDMLIYPAAAKRIKQLRNLFGFRVHIFTYRPWPNAVTATPEAQNKWRQGFPRPPKRTFKGRMVWLEGVWLWLVRRKHLIRYLTKAWLIQNDVVWDRLVIERGSAEVPDPLTHSNNRFTHSMKGAFRIFVEDELPKARKLALTNEIVFLFDQPYNEAPDEDLPPNVVRVRSWDDIYSFVRERM